MANRLELSLADVLAVARIHPFYSDAQYPPDEDSIQAAREAIASSLEQPQLKTQALLWKKDLYAVIERLVNDTSPQNTYRYNVYVSMTGGGGGSKPLFLATDALENRRHRSRFGDFLRNTGVVERGDWVLTTHCAGDLYRSLDLMLEVLENAGASVLPAGNRMPPSGVVELLQAYHVNVLTGDGSQIVQVVHYVSTLSSAERDKIVLDKIIYTSEALTPAQKSHIREVLGPIKLCSVLGSAEAGPYGASPAGLSPSDDTASHADFIIDTRMYLIEILPISYKEGDCIPNPVPEGETGIIVQTSLTRLRNPVVRYVTGDIGSVHPLPERIQETIPKEHRPYMRLLRLEGRDRRFSFAWDGEYYQFEGITAIMGDPNLGVLQWQVILDKMASQEASLEVRILLAQRSERLAPVDEVVSIVRRFFVVYQSNQHRFKLNFVKEIKEFELSKTGQKVIKFIDRFNS